VAAPETASAMDRLCAAVEAHLRVVLRSSDYTVAAVRNTTQLPPAIRARHVAEQQRYIDVWRELVEAARRAGEYWLTASNSSMSVLRVPSPRA